MEALLIAAVVVGAWVVLSHIRKDRFLKEYMELQRRALEKGVPIPGDIKETAIGNSDWSGVTLRLGIISLVLGIMGAVIGLFILPNMPWNSKDTDIAAIFAVFWIFGLLLMAFGAGNLICWFVIDRKRGRKIEK